MSPLWRRLLTLALTAATLAALLWWWPQLAAVPWERWHLRQFLGPLVLLALSHVIRALRLAAEFPEVPRHRTAAILTAHTFWVNVLPLRSGELALPWLLHQRLGVARTRAVATLLWLRVQDAFVLATLALVAWPGWSVAQRSVTAALALGAMLGIWLLVRWRQRLPGRWLRALIAELAQAMRSSRRVWHWTIANWCVKIAAVGWLLAALTDTTWEVGGAGAFAGELAVLQPLQGVAGLGAYEAGVATVLAWHGVSWPEALAAALAAHALLFGTSALMALVAHLWDQRAQARSKTRNDS